MLLDVDIASKEFLGADGRRTKVIADLRFAVARGEAGALVGPSGCGKTTLLRIIAGLDADFSGKVDLPRGSRLGMAFQEPRLLPWRSVFDNLTIAAPQASAEEIDRLLEGLHGIGGHIATALSRHDDVKDIAAQLLDAHDYFFIGRHVGYPTALEGALKLKEITYMHAEGYAAGELKHGPLALIEPGVIVVAVTTDVNMHEKILSNVAEVKARGATVIAVATDEDEQIDAVADFVLRVPSTDAMFTPMVDIVPLQLLAYSLARGLGRNVDRPRNLAKTVTVE